MEKRTSKKKPANDERVYIGARISENTKKDLEAKATLGRRSLSAEIELALDSWVEEKEQET